MKILSRILITALALLAVAWLLPGVEVDGFYTALIVALVLGVINITLKPILLLLTLPINLITLGLFTFVVNGFFFWLVSAFISGFNVSSFLAAIFGALIVSVFKSLGDNLIGD